MPTVFPILAGLIVVGSVAFGVARQIRFAGWSRTSGVVVAFDVSNSEGTDCFAPVIEYSVGASSFRITGKIYSQPPAYSVGQSVSVLYQPSSPSDATIDRGIWNAWLLPLFIAGVGLFVVMMVSLAWL